MPEARQPRGRAERGFEGAPERQERVFGGVVVVDWAPLEPWMGLDGASPTVQVALCVH